MERLNDGRCNPLPYQDRYGESALCTKPKQSSPLRAPVLKTLKYQVTL